MSGDMLAETLRDRLPRLFAAGVDHNDVEAILRRVRRMGDWPVEWERLAVVHKELGERAEADGRLVTAGAAFRRAALYYHVAQFVHFADPARKLRLQREQNRAYARAAPHLAPPAEQVEIPFEDGAFAGNLRRPAGVARPPCVLLNPGADSTKEEFHTLEDEFLVRGLATFSYDGPGQGLTWTRFKLRPDFETAIAAVLDTLCTRVDVDVDRIGIWGRSFGAYAALRGATDPRIGACVAIGGFHDLGAIWDRMPDGTKDSLAYAFGASGHGEAAAHARNYTLNGIADRIRCPLLIVHSGRDNVCPLSESRRIASQAGPHAELKVFEEGNHVCDNIPYKVRPFMTDWMAEKLGAAGRAGAGR
jgi:dipeptidyl aminopeptidase/acylaminoacyl peptidase